MTEVDPPRWGSVAGLPDGLRLALDHARGVAPAPEQLTRMRAGLAPLLTVSAGAGTLAGAGTAVPPAGLAAGKAIGSGAGFSAGGTKMAAVLMVGAALVGAGAVGVAYSPEAHSPQKAETSASKPLASSGPLAPLAPLRGASSATVGAVEPPPRLSEPSRSAPAAASPGPSQAGSRLKPGLPPEAQLLRRARSALASSPEESLRLCQQHQREFAGGILGQEREVLAIEALVRLGQRPQAAGRLSRFRASYAGSPHLPRLEALVSTQQPPKQ